jgi:serine protease Do
MQKGALVNEVMMNSVAADSGLRAGDVIVQVQTQAVDSPADVRRKLDKARQSKRPYIVVLVQREGGFRWITLANGPSEG